jgi:hypothetical protein
VMEQALQERGSFGGASYAEEEAAFAAAARPQNAQRWFIALGMIAIGASLGAVALHWVMVRPLHAQVAGERGAATQELDKRASEVAALRTELSGERARLNELLLVEKEHVAKAQAEAQAAKDQLAALAAAQAAPAGEAKAKTEAKVEPKKHVSRSTKRAAAKRTGTSASTSSKASASDSSSSALRDSVSDDPIGGLE